MATNMPEFNEKILPLISADFSAITGQKGQERPARLSISGFKLREGIIVGLKVTLRGARAKKFLAKVIGIVLPRVRDFRGIKLSGIDQQGNLTFGIKDHVVFPEIILEKTRFSIGLEVTIVPNASMDPKVALEFYRELGLPFERTVEKNKKIS